MTLNTYLKKTADFWKERGIAPKMRYKLNGVTTWAMEIPDDHEDLKHPDFIGLQAEEILMVLPQVVQRRLKPPVFTLKVGQFFADIADKTDKKGLPITHNRSVLVQMCAHRSDPPRVVKLNTPERIMSVLVKAKRQGTENILFFPLPNISETIPIDAAFHVLESKETK